MSEIEDTGVPSLRPRLGSWVNNQVCLHIAQRKESSWSILSCFGKEPWRGARQPRQGGVVDTMSSRDPCLFRQTCVIHGGDRQSLCTPEKCDAKISWSITINVLYTCHGPNAYQYMPICTPREDGETRDMKTLSRIDSNSPLVRKIQFALFCKGHKTLALAACVQS